MVKKNGFKGFEGRIIPQRENELRRMLEIMQQYNVTRYLEIGLRHGTTFHWLGERMPFGMIMIGVDWPGALWGNKKENTREVIDAVAVDLKRKGQYPSIIYGDSKSGAVVEQIKEMGPFDMVFIDGDHTEEGVTADFKNYAPLGNIIAFHDIDVMASNNKRKKQYGVPKLWNEIKTKFARYEEIIDENERGMGIGVVWRV